MPSAFLCQYLYPYLYNTYTVCVFVCAHTPIHTHMWKEKEEELGLYEVHTYLYLLCDIVV